MKQFFERYREVLMYLIFGVLTTVVSFAVYFTVFWTWKAVAGIPEDDNTSGAYILAYTVASVLQWVSGVLFAFFTNRKWVFQGADQNGSLWRQLVKFSAGRVATFFVDWGVTYFGALALTILFPPLVAVELMGRPFNMADIIAKFVAAVIVIIANYILSKLFVFNKKKNK